MVLVHRAKYVSRFWPDWRVLMLCHNKALSLELRSRVGSERIEVTTLDSLAYKFAAAPLKRFRKDNQLFRLRRKSALDNVRTSGDDVRFDAVFVDEAQDLDKDGLDLAWEMLKPKRRMLKPGHHNPGTFVMAEDPDQDIFLRKGRRVDWNPPGLTARGRSTVFRRNYRNTRPILNLTWGLLSELSPQREDVLEPEVVRDGADPAVLECGSLESEANLIASRVKTLLDRGMNPDSILVNFGPSNPNINRLCGAFRRLDIPFLFVNQNRKNRNQVVSAHGVVRIASLRVLKGLEFSQVFIGGTNDIYMPDGQDDLESKAHLLYVAMTRALDDLTITYSGQSEISEALRKVHARL